jgi:hypothetical protein
MNKVVKRMTLLVNEGEPPEEDERAAGPGLSETIQEQIGAKLKALFDHAVEQPVPDKFVQLLEELATKEEGADDSGHELS